MATRHVRVGIFIEYLDHDHGHWCNTCRLSTGLRVWVAVHTLNSAGRMHLQTRGYCTDCEGNDVTFDEDTAGGCD